MGARAAAVVGGRGCAWQLNENLLGCLVLPVFTWQFPGMRAHECYFPCMACTCRASYRGQLLARTVKGMECYQRALRLLAALEAAPAAADHLAAHAAAQQASPSHLTTLVSVGDLGDEDAVEGTRLEQVRAWADRVAHLRFKHVVSAQVSPWGVGWGAVPPYVVDCGHLQAGCQSTWRVTLPHHQLLHACTHPPTLTRCTASSGVQQTCGSDGRHAPWRWVARFPWRHPQSMRYQHMNPSNPKVLTRLAHHLTLTSPALSLFHLPFLPAHTQLLLERHSDTLQLSFLEGGAQGKPTFAVLLQARRTMSSGSSGSVVLEEAYRWALESKGTAPARMPGLHSRRAQRCAQVQ